MKVKLYPVSDFNSYLKNDEELYTLNANFSYAVVAMESDKHEAMIMIKTSILRETKIKLSKLSKYKFPLHEFLLAAGFTFLGIVLRYIWVGDFTPSIWYWTVSPVLAIGFLVSYFILRHKEEEVTCQVALDLLNRLPTDQEMQKAEEKDKAETLVFPLI